jgi:DNA-binding SARP family transcriptional activator/tetratricopeptide (TPR) repeat protein
MEFRILGPLEVLDGERALDVAGPKQRALLAVLLMNANQVVSKDSLIDSLWGAEPPATASKAIQVYVSQLRRVLGKKRLETTAPGYLLRVHDEELDLHRFEALREQAKDADAKTAAALLHEALALWRGPPLGEFAYDGFAGLEIARLEELRLACLEERIAADLALGRSSGLVGELEGLVAEHPLRELLRAQLMLALYRSGRQVEALEAYQDARRVLVGELGIQPGKSLRELEKAILQQDPSVDLGPAEVEAIVATDGSKGTFVGREAELSELRAGLDAAIAGQGRLFLLAGEPGIGKSRLAEELVGQARARGASVLVGRCWEAGGAPAYWPWVQSLRMYVEQTEPEALRGQLGAGAADVAPIIPELRALFPDLPQPSLESEGARFRLFDSTARFLRNAAAARPLVLVLDDLHAADEPSLLLLRFLAAELAGSRILVVATYRDVDPTVRDPLASTLVELARESVTRRIELGGLTETDVGRYIELSGGVTPPAVLVATIHTETEGNPLFVGEVVRLLAPEGRLPDVDLPVLWSLGIPQGVREVIGRRVHRLSSECTRVLTIASVVGREFGLDALQRLTELPADELLDVLDEAMGARVLASVPGARARLRFAHALIRETLYDQLTTPRRVQLHRRAGEALEAFYAEDPEPHLAELAHHFFEAAPGGDVGKALEYAQRAGERALELLAYEEAARLYELALQALELKRSVDPPARCELLLRLGEVRERAGDGPAAASAFLEASEIARSAGASEQFGRAALGYGGRFVWVAQGFLDEEAVPLLEDALRAVGEEDSALRARLLARLAGALRDQPKPERRTELSAQAVATARRLGDGSALAYALDGRYSTIWGPDNAEERLPIADEILRLAEEVGDRERAIQGRFYRAVALLELGQMADVRRELTAMESLAAELRQPAQRWYVTILQAILALFVGDFDGARESIPNAFELAGTMRQYMPLGSVRGQTFMLHREQGQLGEVIEETERTVEEMPVDMFRCIVANLYSELGREDDARAALEGLAEIDFDVQPDNDKLFGWSLLAEVCSFLGDSVHAPRLYALLRPHAHRNAVCHPACAAGSVSRYLGLLSATSSRWEEAERHFEDGLEMNERMGARPWVAHTQHDYARMLLARDLSGDRDKAQLLLAKALATYGELGMATSAASASALAADVGLLAP